MPRLNIRTANPTFLPFTATVHWGTGVRALHIMADQDTMAVCVNGTSVCTSASIDSVASCAAACSARSEGTAAVYNHALGPGTASCLCCGYVICVWSFAYETIVVTHVH